MGKHESMDLAEMGKHEVMDPAEMAKHEVLDPAEMANMHPRQGRSSSVIKSKYVCIYELIFSSFQVDHSFFISFKLLAFLIFGVMMGATDVGTDITAGITYFW